MSETAKLATPRRKFLKNTVQVAAASALAGMAIPRVHAGEDNTIRLALSCADTWYVLRGLSYSNASPRLLSAHRLSLTHEV